MSTRTIYIVVRETVSFVAEQLSTTRQSERIARNAFDMLPIHRPPTTHLHVVVEEACAAGAPTDVAGAPCHGAGVGVGPTRLRTNGRSVR